MISLVSFFITMQFAGEKSQFNRTFSLTGYIIIFHLIAVQIYFSAQMTNYQTQLVTKNIVTWSLHTDFTSRAPERNIFSDPARSTRLSLPHLINSSSPITVSFTYTVMVKTECERLHQNNIH